MELPEPALWRRALLLPEAENSAEKRRVVDWLLQELHYGRSRPGALDGSWPQDSQLKLSSQPDVGRRDRALRRSRDRIHRFVDEIPGPAAALLEEIGEHSCDPAALWPTSRTVSAP